MSENLRIFDVKVLDSTNISATFSHSLNEGITSSNISIISNLDHIPDGIVLKINISNNILNIETRPLTPFAQYFILFKSINGNFRSINGDAFLFEDNTNNKILVVAPGAPDNTFKDGLVQDLADNIYSMEPGSVIDQNLDNQASMLLKAYNDIRQLKNDNYLSLFINDERKIRGKGPFDRLDEEGAYEILRVSKNPTGTTSSEIQHFAEFPNRPITLQTTKVVEETLIAGSGPSTFNKLVLTVSKKPVIKLNKVKINYSDLTSATYDIDTYGYQINNSKYDEFASTLLTLEDNQFKLSDLVLEDSNFRVPTAADEIVIDYEYKNLGKIIDDTTIEVYTLQDNIHETAPSLQIEFSLKFAPIVDDNGNIATISGVTFLDPQANPPFSSAHPAFTKELSFALSNLPKAVGEYAIDYNRGRIFVYGEDSKNNGTGPYPPLMIYNYKKIYNSRLDYTYDVDLAEMAANPLRDLISQNGYVSFEFEETLVSGIDFNAQIHTEVLNERIENRLNSTGSLTVLNTPVTNVFRIFNETIGEVYKISRWNDSKVFFNFTVPPTIKDIERESVTFEKITDEILITHNEFQNGSNIRILKILLQNNNIISSTEDNIASSFNTSISFSRPDLFLQELYFDSQELTILQNTNRLNKGQYQIDYINGIIYIGVSLSQNNDLGSVNYKRSNLISKYSHLLNISSIYNSRSLPIGIDKKINYVSFSDNSVILEKIDRSDERFLNNDDTQQYQITDDVITVTDNIKLVRGLYDAYNLNNFADPINFADTTTASNNEIILSGGILHQDNSSVGASSIVSLPLFSAGIEIESVISIKRLSDNNELFDSSAIIGQNNITLSGLNSPILGDKVLVIYKVRLNASATPIIDYNRGDLFIDYTYLADEILVSYEHGDNSLDFRESGALDAGDEYFVTYKAGALRDALLKNFGSLIKIPIINTFDTTLSRETYRDAIKGALQSFMSGPTIPALTNIVSSISHVDPRITESAFDVWSLGISNLYRSAIDYSDSIVLSKGKFDNGFLSTKDGQTVSFPLSSNLRIEEGTLEMWTIPEWNGLDNDATLTFEIYKNNSLLDANDIYIGASSFNPTIENNQFILNKNDDLTPKGIPSAIFTKTGLFIFFNTDINKWTIYARDIVTENNIYSGTITSSGEVYDVKFVPGLNEINDVLRSAVNSIYFEFNLDNYDAGSEDGYNDGYSNVDGYSANDGYIAGYSFDGITFMADNEHYLFDFGENKTKNRFSLYKDGSGYLNFRVFDNNKRNRVNRYVISSDISNWRAGEHHHVAISWKLNTSEHKDEMHLFIDGKEIPNIIKYGGKPVTYETDRFRTVKPEIIAGVIPLKIVGSSDLITAFNSNTVSSETINFTNEGVIPGYTINIHENGFGDYTILAVSGSTLILNQSMPATLENVHFSINQVSTTVSSEIDLYPNIAVSIIDSNGNETEIPGTRSDNPAYKISKNAFNNNILTIYNDASAGDIIAIRTLGLNHRRAKERVYVWGNSTNILKTLLPPPINLNEVEIYPVLLPLVKIGPGNSSLSLGKFIGSFNPTQPSNDTEGRVLAVRLTGNNIDFNTLANITINGTTAEGPVLELLQFNSAKTLFTTLKFKTITSVDYAVTPFNTNNDSTSLEIKEKYSITESDNNSVFPIVRFSYKTQQGTGLKGTINSNTLQDLNGYFIDSNVGQKIVISSPGSVAGTYIITGRSDINTITVDTDMAATFTGGKYSIFNTSLGRSGFQNGFFTFEVANQVNAPFNLKEGTYEFDYSTYLEAPLAPPTNTEVFVGSDMFGLKQANAVIDELRILSTMLTDVRVGESIADNQDYVTTDYNSIKPMKKNQNTLMLCHFDSLPLLNDSDVWVSADKSFVQSANAINENFGKCLVITDTPIIKENQGLLTTNSEGTIEFWVSPRFDTYNDPIRRYYFDAASSLIEESISISNGTVKTNNSISSVLSVRLLSDINNTGKDYFAGGSIAADFRTINLGTSLPGQETAVKINYIPAGLLGDRISIFKDEQGFIVFNVHASGEDFQVRQPVFWQRDSWHRIMATFKFNRKDHKDEIRLFVDGEERGIIRFGAGLLFGEGIIFGQGFAGVDNSVLITDINFTDHLNEFYIGSSYLNTGPAQAKFDNIRLSDISRNPLVINGQAKDINYQSNIKIVEPVIEDAFTTLLLDFDSIVFKKDDFAIIHDKNFGIFNFIIDVIDSFGIINDNPKVKQILESLVRALKPAQSKVKINYV